MKNARLNADDWSEIGDLIAQCIDAAEIDVSYTDAVRTKAIAMMTRIQNEAVDRGLKLRSNSGNKPIKET